MRMQPDAASRPEIRPILAPDFGSTVFAIYNWRRG
jgi:hypothetical protein